MAYFIPEIKAESSDEFVVYKKRKYRLQFLGHTKFGYRAKLQFMDKSNSFWADGKLIYKYMTKSEVWNYIGEEEPSMYDVFDSMYDIDPDFGDH